ncbi:MAG: C-GCAxxG-C-C family protein [Treponema sp.]|jgi:C_GCAxxG_C_C family probable redox protein|nr:C-GCAxxG-C-C family protein [Treponema sp.]
MTRTESALEGFNRGFNCAQAVLSAFAGDLGMDRETAMRIASGFGAGLGRKREICGAVSGAVMVLGLARGGGETPEKVKENNREIYRKIQEITGPFAEEKGSLICMDLLKGCTVPPGGDLRQRCCAGLVALSCSLLEKSLVVG